MLRIECECGKFLKVDEDLAGKRVKCPACGESLLVKKSAATAVSTKPAARRAAAQDEDEEAEDTPAPRKGKKQPAKAGCSPVLILLLAGGAAFVFLGLAVAGVGVWWFFFRGGKPVEVKFFVPSKKGDKREIRLSADGSMKQTVDAPGADPALLKQLNRNTKMKSSMTALVRVLEVDEHGEETKVELTVLEHSASEEDDNGPVQPGRQNVPKNSVFIGERIDDHWFWKDPTGKQPTAFLAELQGGGLGGNATGSDGPETDRIFGTSEKKKVGDTWPMNIEEAKRIDAEKKAKRGKGIALEPELDKNPPEFSGTVKLVGVTKEAGNSFIDLQVNFTVKQKLGKSKNPTNVTFSYDVRMPGDYATGAVRRAAKMTVNGEDESDAPQGFGKPDIYIKTTIALTYSVTMDIKYLGNSPIEDQPRDTGKGTPKDTSKETATDTPKDTKPTDTPKDTIKTDTPKPPDLPKLAVGEVKAKWFAGNNIDVSIDYTNSGGPFKRDSKYIAYVYVPDAKGVKKPFEVQVVNGELMFPKSGRFYGLVKLPDNFAGPNSTKLDVAIFEAPGGTSDLSKYLSMVANQDFMIAGTPPAATPDPKAARIDLTNAKVEHTGNKYIFTADYRFAEGSPDANTAYSWQVELNQGGNKTTMTLEKKFGTEYAAQGKLYISKDNLNVQDNTPFVMTVQQTRNAKTDLISNAAPGLVTLVKDVRGTPEFVAAKVTRAGKVTNVEFSYKLNGVVDPSADYVVKIEFRGGKGLKNTGFLNLAGYPAGQANAEMNDAKQIPVIVQHTDFEIILLEVTQKNPQGKRLAQYSGKVQ